MAELKSKRTILRPKMNVHGAMTSMGIEQCKVRFSRVFSEGEMDR
jgi:hypothetical protein